MTIRRRLVLLSAVAVAVAVAIASTAGYVVVRGNLRGQVDTALRSDGPKAFFVRAGIGPGAGVAVNAPPGDEKALTVFDNRLKADAAMRAKRAGVQVALPPEKFGGATGIAQVVTP